MNATLMKRLKELRNYHGYKQQDVADQLSISRQTLSSYENGRIDPTSEMIVKLCEFFHVTTDFLISDSPVSDPIYSTDQNKFSALRDEPIDMKNFISFLDSEEVGKRYDELTLEERKLLFYYFQLEERDKKDIMNFLEIKIQNSNRT